MRWSLASTASIDRCSRGTDRGVMVRGRQCRFGQWRFRLQRNPAHRPAQLPQSLRRERTDDQRHAGCLSVPDSQRSSPLSPPLGALRIASPCLTGCLDIESSGRNGVPSTKRLCTRNASAGKSKKCTTLGSARTVETPISAPRARLTDPFGNRAPWGISGDGSQTYSRGAAARRCAHRAQLRAKSSTPPLRPHSPKTPLAAPPRPP